MCPCWLVHPLATACCPRTPQGCQWPPHTHTPASAAQREDPCPRTADRNAVVAAGRSRVQPWSHHAPVGKMASVRILCNAVIACWVVCGCSTGSAGAVAATTTVCGRSTVAWDLHASRDSLPPTTDNRRATAAAPQRGRSVELRGGRTLKPRRPKEPKDTSPVLATADGSVRCWADRDPREFPRYVSRLACATSSRPTRSRCSS